MFDTQEIKPTIIKPERPNSFGNRPFDCIVNALVYGLRNYRDEIGNWRFTHSNAGFLYHSLAHTDDEEITDTEKLSSKKNTSPLITLLHQIFDNYPQPLEGKFSWCYKPEQRQTFWHGFFFEENGKFITEKHALIYDNVSAVWANISNQNNRQKEEKSNNDDLDNNDDSEMFQIRLFLEDLNPHSQQIVETSMLAIDKALTKTDGDPSTTHSLRESAEKHKKYLPYTTRFTVAFQLKYQDSNPSFNFFSRPRIEIKTETLAYVNFVIYPDDRITIEVFVNEENGEDGRNKPKFKKILEVSPGEHAIKHQEFERYLDQLYSRLIK